MNNLKAFAKQIRQCKVLYLMILPPIITVFIFHYIPIYGLQIAFKDYRTSLGIMGSEWVGLKHFINFVNYPYFGKIMTNTLSISLMSMLTFPIPVIFSLMLNEVRQQRLKKTVQMITYAPHFVSVVVVASMTILFLNREGLVNNILSLFGLPRLDYMSQPSLFAPIYVITDLWQGLGWGTIIYLAALSGVSPELIEAAKIDGAARMKIIFNINIPHILPTVITMLILKVGTLVSVGFEKVFLLQNPLNMEASSIISTYVYEMGLTGRQYSYSAAIGLFNNVINIILIVLANTLSKKVANYGLW